LVVPTAPSGEQHAHVYLPLDPKSVSEWLFLIYHSAVAVVFECILLLDDHVVSLGVLETGLEDLLQPLNNTNTRVSISLSD
jgi:hypothetical protein